MPISEDIRNEIENDYNKVIKNFDSYNYALQLIKKYGGSKEETKEESGTKAK